uniref:Troponin I (inferred by orthology to a D. melanogaster protein) n=1 Tax=Strongyloides venezuelensis TaxID=75913 RepID=A0A0K0EX77_STRVS
MSNDRYQEDNEYIRYGGCQGDDTDEESARKNEERERKKAEVRKRLEEAGNKKKSKKGFLTPERKKKLRKLLMMKAAEDLKQQQLLKEQERQKILSERTMPLPAIDGVDDHGKLEQIYNDIFNRLVQLEEQKYDINQLVLAKDQEINELTIAVNDLRGKFVKPVLKKVSKYDNKFKKMAATKEDKQDFRANLKVVKKETVIDDLVAKKKFDKPDWSKKGGADGEAKEEKVPKEETQPADEEAPPADEEVVEEVEEAEEEEEEEE